MSDSVWPRRRQPARLLRPWDSPGKNTGVGCHFLLQCMKAKAQSCLTLRDPIDCSLPDSSVHGSFQARVLEWGAIAFSLLISKGHKWKPWKETGLGRFYSQQKIETNSPMLHNPQPTAQGLCMSAPFPWRGSILPHKEKEKVLVTQSCLTLCNPVDCEAPLSMKFSRQEY